MEYELLPLQRDFIESIAAIERLCFSDPWSAGSLLEEVDNPNAVFLVCRQKGGPVVGYAGFLYVLDEGYIANIAVHPAFRRSGVGDALMKGLLSEARLRGLSFLTLEVRRGNLPAVGLYKKYGFIPCGLRRGFYEKPREDALLMKFTFGDEYENSGD